MHGVLDMLYGSDEVMCKDRVSLPGNGEWHEPKVQYGIDQVFGYVPAGHTRNRRWRHNTKEERNEGMPTNYDNSRAAFDKFMLESKL